MHEEVPSRRKSSCRGYYAASLSLQQLSAQKTSERSVIASTGAVFGVFTSALASNSLISARQRYVIIKATKITALPVSNLSLLHLSATRCPENWGEATAFSAASSLESSLLCSSLPRTHALSTWTVLLRVLFGLNLVSQTQLGWPNDQVWLETALPLLWWRDITDTEDSLSCCFLPFWWVGVLGLYWIAVIVWTLFWVRELTWGGITSL